MQGTTTGIESTLAPDDVAFAPCMGTCVEALNLELKLLDELWKQYQCQDEAIRYCYFRP